MDGNIQEILQRFLQSQNSEDDANLMPLLMERLASDTTPPTQSSSGIQDTSSGRIKNPVEKDEASSSAEPEPNHPQIKHPIPPTPQMLFKEAVEKISSSPESTRDLQGRWMELSLEEVTPFYLEADSLKEEFWQKYPQARPKYKVAAISTRRNKALKEYRKRKQETGKETNVRAARK